MTPPAAVLRPLLKVVIGVLALVLSLQLAFHLVAAPNLRVTKLSFLGDRPRTEVPLGSLLGLRDNEYYFSVDEAAVKSRLEALPWVKSAAVRKKFPDTVAVDLKVRQPLALDWDGTTALLVDDEGRLFEAATSSRGLDLPVVSGIPKLTSGEQYPEATLPLFARLAELRRESPALYRMVSEVQLRNNDRGGFDAVVYPVRTPVRILLGDRWDVATLRQMFVLLDLVEKQGWTGKTGEIDFRATPVVFRPRES